MQLQLTSKAQSFCSKLLQEPLIFLPEIFHSSVGLKSSGVKTAFLPKYAVTYVLNNFPVSSWFFIGRKLMLYMNHRIKCPPTKDITLLETHCKWHIYCAFNFHLQYMFYTEYAACIRFCFHNLLLTPNKNWECCSRIWQEGTGCG